MPVVATKPDVATVAPSVEKTTEVKDNTGLYTTVALLAGGTIVTMYLLNKSDKPKKLNGIADSALGKELIGKVVGYGVVIGAGYLLIARPLLQKVGVVDTKEDKILAIEEKTFSSSNLSPFNPAYYKSVKVGATIATADAERLAKQFYDADGYFNDDEDSVYAGLKAMVYKANLSRVAEVFANKYQKDLYSYLRAFLDDSEMTIVHNIVNALK